MSQQTFRKKTIFFVFFEKNFKVKHKYYNILDVFLLRSTIPNWHLKMKNT